MNRELPQRLFSKLLRVSSRLVGAFERLSKPRWQSVYRHPVAQSFAGVIIALCGVKLLLPLPIPMSNFFPGVAAALVAAASFEEDGLVFLAGVAMFVVSLAYFALLAFGGVAAFGEFWPPGG